jgi:hypothetical protein
MPDLPGQTYLPGAAPPGLEAREWRPVNPLVADSPADRKRATTALRRAILDFARTRLANGAPLYHMGDLTAYVAARVRTAPDSAGRIMRMLAADGALSYELVSRAASLYRIVAVHAPQEDRTT